MTMPRVCLDQPHVQRDDVAVLEERILARRRQRDRPASPAPGGLARPHHHIHAERPAIVGNDAGNAAVAVEAERVSAQRIADADLPVCLP